MSVADLQNLDFSEEVHIHCPECYSNVVLTRDGRCRVNHPGHWHIVSIERSRHPATLGREFCDDCRALAVEWQRDSSMLMPYYLRWELN